MWPKEIASVLLINVEVHNQKYRKCPRKAGSSSMGHSYDHHRRQTVLITWPISWDDDHPMMKHAAGAPFTTGADCFMARGASTMDGPGRTGLSVSFKRKPVRGNLLGSVHALPADISRGRRTRSSGQGDSRQRKLCIVLCFSP